MFHKLRSLLLLLIVLTGQTTVLASVRFSFPDPGKFALPAKSGPPLFKQCSRSAPERIVEFWQPSTDEINELERLLIGNLAAREKRGTALPPNGSYHRQYIGFTKNKVRFIYGNYYPSNLPFNSKKNKPLIMCDGGPLFWGIVFRVDTKQFDEPTFNGSI